MTFRGTKYLHHDRSVLWIGTRWWQNQRSKPAPGDIPPPPPPPAQRSPHGCVCHSWYHLVCELLPPHRSAVSVLRISVRRSADDMGAGCELRDSHVLIIHLSEVCIHKPGNMSLICRQKHVFRLSDPLKCVGMQKCKSP